MERRTFDCASDAYVIELVTKPTGRRNEIVDMLVENFLTDETLVKSLRLKAGGMSKSEEDDFLADERLMMETVVDDGTVLLAIHKETKRIAGAVVIIIHERISSDEDNKSPEPFGGRLRSRVMKDFFKYMGKIADLGAGRRKLFEKYPQSRVHADFELIGVNRLDRRKGIAHDLYKSAIEVIGKDMTEVSLVSGTYTSNYTKSIARRIGKVSVAEVNVMQFKDECGNPVFQDTEPHNIVSLMAMEI